LLATGWWRYSCTTSSPSRLPVLLTSTEALKLPFVEIDDELSCRFETENFV
jgi:hypothetical protein